MQDPAFLAHKTYLSDVERAAKPGTLRDFRSGDARDRQGWVRLVSVAALAFALGVVQPWIV